MKGGIFQSWGTGLNTRSFWEPTLPLTSTSPESNVQSMHGQRAWGPSTVRLCTSSEYPGRYPEYHQTEAKRHLIELHGCGAVGCVQVQEQMSVYLAELGAYKSLVTPQQLFAKASNQMAITPGPAQGLLKYSGGFWMDIGWGLELPH